MSKKVKQVVEVVEAEKVQKQRKSKTEDKKPKRSRVEEPVVEEPVAVVTAVAETKPTRRSKEARKDAAATKEAVVAPSKSADKPAEKPTADKPTAGKPTADKPTTEKPDKKPKKEKAPAAPKKVNNKPLLYEKHGLNLAPVRVRNLLVNIVFNRNQLQAKLELKKNKDALINETNLKYGYQSFHGLTQETRDYLKLLVDSQVAADRVKYERRRIKELTNACPKEADGKRRVLSKPLLEFTEAKRKLLRADPNADLTALHIKLDKNFYNNFKRQDEIYAMVGQPAFDFYTTLVSQNTINLDESARVRLTCFLELLLQQVIKQANVACQLNGKRTINLSSMVSETFDDNYLFPLIENLLSWKNGRAWPALKAAEVAAQKAAAEAAAKAKAPLAPKPKKTPLEFIDVNALNPKNKYKFSSYVIDICREISRNLAANPPKITYPEGATEQEIADSYRNLSVSSEFKILCAQIVLELVHNIGNILSIVLHTYHKRKVDKKIIDAIIQTYHISISRTDKLEQTYAALDALTERFNAAQAVLAKERAGKPKRKTGLTMAAAARKQQ